MATAIKPRHALGLPAGSIRAILALGVLGYLWLLVLNPGKDNQPQASRAFIYLQVLMVLILAHFYTAHGKTIGSAVSDRSPLGMPRGTVRVFLLLCYMGLAFYMYRQNLKFQIEDTGPVFLDLAILISSFVAGHFITAVVRGIAGGMPAWFQDIQAWFAILALVLLGVIVIIRFVINSTLIYEKQVDPEVVEMILAGIVGFYFGARS